MNAKSMARWALTSSAAWMLSCASAPKSGETLMESVRTYHEGIRWQRFAAAAGRIPPAERSAFVDEWDERSSNLKITDYEIIDVSVRGADAARVQVKISWYDDSEGTLRDTHAEQTWRRRGKLWWLTNEVRVRGATMPGLLEPVDSAHRQDDGIAQKTHSATGDAETSAATESDVATHPIPSPSASQNRSRQSNQLR
jgi:hypothetical protein